ncbi:hypothetical protein VKT23_017481 [Stygiomarasmius scandens]|uniref:Uncharacterized protein n=1 Tax=Marasmiellus scandens TaxID=2682957 RepID=A0ABR1ITG7_9AGAR
MTHHVHPYHHLSVAKKTVEKDALVIGQKGSGSKKKKARRAKPTPAEQVMRWVQRGKRLFDKITHVYQAVDFGDETAKFPKNARRVIQYMNNELKHIRSAEDLELLPATGRIRIRTHPNMRRRNPRMPSLVALRLDQAISREGCQELEECFDRLRSANARFPDRRVDANRASNYVRATIRRLYSRKQYLETRVWLDFGGAFLCIAVKEGSSEVYHLDWNDDPNSFAWIIAVGRGWTGGDFCLPQLGKRIPLQSGQILGALTRQLIHCGTATEGRRIVLTCFTDYGTMRKADEWDEGAEGEEIATRMVALSM